MYQQLDGFDKGSPFGPALANIFVKLYGYLFLKNTPKPLLYCKYVDDTFGIFNNKAQCNQISSKS